MKKKGFFFLFIFGVLFWGYYFMRVLPTKIEKRPVRSDIIRKVNKGILEISIEIFFQKKNRYPRALQELSDKGYIENIPDPGRNLWRYDPKTGDIE